ncbi:MAG: glycosyltransferase family 4 protein [Deinococcales bacterium]|nr:glycosyltransferase family 4 protein [Chitinophagaceae bacterium]
MKIIIASLTFLPNVGGLENVMAGLAEEWSYENNIVTVFTDIATTLNDDYPYKINRQQSTINLFKAVAKADVFVEANISLKTFWVGLLNRKKWFVIHHLHYQHATDWKAKLKNYLTKFSNNISVSQYIANTLLGKGTVINNFFQPSFQRIPSIAKTNDIAFLGRLVSDKGATILLQAINHLNNKNSSVTIIGDGPERNNLMQEAEQFQLKNIQFIGIKKGQALVEELNKHKILVVPSIWPEPFGIVALEAMACGCLVVASNNGGLPEAVNKFGILYNNNDPQKLALAIENALLSFEDYEQNEVAVNEYLSSKKVIVIAQQYINYFKNTIANTN